jgi:hypothetical protein
MEMRKTEDLLKFIPQPGDEAPAKRTDEFPNYFLGEPVRYNKGAFSLDLIEKVLKDMFYGRAEGEDTTGL